MSQSIGTKVEEDISVLHSRNLVISVTVCMAAFCCLEIGSYFLYNRKVFINALKMPTQNPTRIFSFLVCVVVRNEHPRNYYRLD